MDALLFSLVAAALAGVGDRTQLLAALVSAKRERPVLALAGLVLAAAGVGALAAVLGGVLHGIINVRAQTLLVALALAYAGIVGLLAPSPPGMAARFKGGSFLTMLIFGFLFANGSRSQFLILALATRADVPTLTAVGGAIGIVAVAVPAALLGKRFLELRLRPVRIGLSALFLVAAAVVLVNAPSV